MLVSSIRISRSSRKPRSSGLAASGITARCDQLLAGGFESASVGPVESGLPPMLYRPTLKFRPGRWRPAGRWRARAGSVKRSGAAGTSSRLSTSCALGGAQALLHQPQPARQRGQQVVIHRAHRDRLQQAFQRDGALALHRAGVDQLLLGDAHRVHDHEARLAGVGRGGDGLEIGLGDDARAAPQHLLEQHPRAHRAHEEQRFQRLDVGAGGDHVHRHGDARVVGGAESADQVLRQRRRRGR